MPEIFIIAGCIGAGKTTAAYNLLPSVFETSEFINADEIARGNNPGNVEAAAFSAGKIMLQRINELIKNKKSFAFETTLSGNNYFEIIKNAKANGFTVTLFYVYLEKFELAIERVALRVLKGGHHIPVNIIECRYFKGLMNLKKYILAVDEWYILDNSNAAYNYIAKSINKKEEIINFDIFNLIYNYGK